MGKVTPEGQPCLEAYTEVALGFPWWHLLLES